MLIDFNQIKEIQVTGMNGGEGEVCAKMFMDKRGKIIPSRIAPGASISMHTHATSDDINYILSGEGRAVCDGQEELLQAGVCHICPKGSSHSISNTGSDYLVMLTIVVER